MLNKKLFNNKIFLIAILSFILLAQSGNAFAWHRPLRRTRYHHGSRKVFTIPNSYISIVIGGGNSHYRDRRRCRTRSYHHVFAPSRGCFRTRARYYSVNFR